MTFFYSPFIYFTSCKGHSLLKGYYIFSPNRVGQTVLALYCRMWCDCSWPSQFILMIWIYWWRTEDISRVQFSAWFRKSTQTPQCILLLFFINGLLWSAVIICSDTHKKDQSFCLDRALISDSLIWFSSSLHMTPKFRFSCSSPGWGLSHCEGC